MFMAGILFMHVKQEVPALTAVMQLLGWVSKKVLICTYQLSNNTAGSDKCRSAEKQNVCFLGGVLGIKK